MRRSHGDRRADRVEGEMGNTWTQHEFNYDAFLAEVGKARDGLEPTCVIARSVEQAEVLAAWCVENGIGEPEIVVLEE